MTKALVVFSGGLDSILTVKILEEQGINVTGLSFDSYFFDTQESKKVAEQLGISLIVKDISKKQLETVENPQYGHGSALNPCIDCHGLMFRVAGELAKIKTSAGKKFDIVATGEVLGQRPFSQNSDALKKVEKLAGVEILRPLSAKLLPKTNYEEEGLVDRRKLLDISGKSRKRQLELVKKYGVEYFPSPAGGCRLTENEFGAKVKQLLENDGQERELDKVDFELLRIGRHHWINNEQQATNNEQQNNRQSKASKVGSLERAKQAKGQAFSERNKKDKPQIKIHIILGKNHEENKQLQKSAKKSDILIELASLMGPMALIMNGANLNKEVQDQIISETKKLILARAKNPDKKGIEEVEWTMINKSVKL